MGRFHTLTMNTASDVITAETRSVLLKNGVAEAEADNYIKKILHTLDDYAAHLGGSAKVMFQIRRRFTKIEVRLMISGDPYDPVSRRDIAASARHFYNELFGVDANDGTFGFYQRYLLRTNIVSFIIPLDVKPRKLITDPVIWGVLLGLLCGLLCKFLPRDVNAFIVDELATHAQSIILGVISGVMGPVIFISLVSSICALESVNELTDRGFKIIRRFLRIIMFLIVVSILVAGLFFRNFGSGNVTFSLSQIYTMVFDIVPTNLIDPFLKNNTAQLVILGLLAGAGILMLGDRAAPLKRGIDYVNKWVMSIMHIVLQVMPAIPFLSMLITVGSGKSTDLLSGWKYIAASYAVFFLTIVIKAAKTSIRSGVKNRDLWRMIRPVAKVSFTTGSTTAAMRTCYDVSEKEMHIKPAFSSLWIPMSTAMLSPKTAINVVIGAFMAMQLENMQVSLSFLAVLFIVTMELSTASPGIAAAQMVMMKAAGLPLNYVGLFSSYRLLTDNFGSACAISYNMLEELEVAHKMGEIGQDETAEQPDDGATDAPSQ